MILVYQLITFLYWLTFYSIADFMIQESQRFKPTVVLITVHSHVTIQFPLQLQAIRTVL